MNSILFLILLFAVPCIIAYVVSAKIGRKGRNAMIIISALGTTAGILSMNFHVQATKILSVITGHYNLEATVFYAFFAAIVSAGVFTGVIINKNKKYR